MFLSVYAVLVYEQEAQLGLVVIRSPKCRPDAALNFDLPVLTFNGRLINATNVGLFIKPFNTSSQSPPQELRDCNQSLLQA
jgi:hypothetical protein